jgi:hypothetical protein
MAREEMVARSAVVKQLQSDGTGGDGCKTYAAASTSVSTSVAIG